MSTNPLQAYLKVQRSVDREMAKALLDAAKESEAILKRMGDGSNSVERARLRQASRELRKMAAELWGGPITASMKKGMEAAAVAAVGSEPLLNEVLRKALGADYRVYQQAVSFDARNSVDTLRAKDNNAIPLSRQVYKSRALSQGWVDREIKRALALQMSWKQLADRVQHLISPNTPGGVSYAARRLARSEINNAFHRAQIDRRSQEPWTEGMQWHLSRSHPERDKCNDYAESVHVSGMAAGVFPAGKVPAKPHPNCLCFLTTVVMDEDQFISSFLDGKFDTYMDSVIG